VQALYLIMVTFLENRGIARTYIPMLIDAGLSGRSALKWLQDQGRGYRRVDFTEDWREIGGFEKKKETFKYIRKEYKPDVKTLTVTSENLSKEYSYIAKVGVQSKITGEVEFHEWRYATDELVSIAEAEEEIKAETEKEPSPDPDQDYISVEITGCKKRMVL